MRLPGQCGGCREKRVKDEKKKRVPGEEKSLKDPEGNGEEGEDPQRATPQLSGEGVG